MNISPEQLAELIAGIARSQTAIIDAIERANGGWRNAHLLQQLNVAANVRIADPRLIDLPSRVLLRMQGRGTVEISAIVADLERLTSGTAAAAAAASTPAPSGPELDFSAKG